MADAARKRARVSSSGSESSSFGQIVSGTSVNAAVDAQEQVKQQQEWEKKAEFKDEIVTFGDPSTADVFVHLECDEGTTTYPVLHLHSNLLSKSRYFATLFSERWNGGGAANDDDEENTKKEIHVKINMSHSLADYMQTLRLFYTDDLTEVIVSVQSALSILPIAAELLFDECLSACLRFVEAVPWSKDEEKQITNMVNYLQLADSSSRSLLARLTPVDENAVEKMLSELVYAATHSTQGHAASVKAFVAKLLNSHKSKAVVKQVLDEAFRNGLKTVKDSVEDYSSPNVRGRHDEIEAMQRHSLHTAVVCGRHLLWLVERMIELKVAETAVFEWSEQSTFTANLKRAFMDDVWRNNVPGLPAVLLRCTWKLANAMVTGSILVSKDVRKKLVRDWLPVLVTSKENAVSANCNKQLHQDLEDVFLKLSLTLPISDAQELLHQCLCFASRSHDDSSHLALAFSTWFRRAGSG